MEQEHGENKPTESLAGVEAKGANAALKGDIRLAEMAQQFDVHPTQITDLGMQLLERSSVGFGEP